MHDWQCTLEYVAQGKRAVPITGYGDWRLVEVQVDGAEAQAAAARVE